MRLQCLRPAPLVAAFCSRRAPQSASLPRNPFALHGRTVMLGAIKKALGLGAEACAGCNAEVLATCEAAEPGSVTPHAAHVLLRLARPEGADPGATDEAWWPESVDKEPCIEAVNAAIKEAGDRVQAALNSRKVKVTAFDHLEAAAPPAPGTCDALVFPAGIRFSGLALDAAPAAVLAALTGDSAAVAAAGGRELQGSSLLVCCHTARDARCGHVGPPLAARLAELLGQQGGAGATCTVYKSSHVGGHKYAGNVLVYGLQPCSGDWFGGLNAGNAPAFVEALLAAKAPSGAAGDKALRPWWRGRVGMSKEEQLAHFTSAVKDIEDLL